MLLETEPVEVLTLPAQPTANAVVFDHVSFAFDDNMVLRDVSFTMLHEGRI